MLGVRVRTFCRIPVHISKEPPVRVRVLGLEGKVGSRVRRRGRIEQRGIGTFCGIAVDISKEPPVRARVRGSGVETEGYSCQE